MTLENIQIIRKETIPSTQDFCKENVKNFLKNSLTVVFAKEQTKGRGRRERSWISPKEGNLYITFAFYFPLSLNPSFLASLLALSTVQAVLKENILLKIKWPNDLFLDGKKVGGILGEVVFYQGKKIFLGGLGLNVNMEKKTLLSLQCPAISFAASKGKYFATDPIFQEIVKTYFENLNNSFQDGFSHFSDLSSFLLHKKGDSLCFHHQDKIIEGFFDSLSLDGGLILHLLNGEKKTFFFGDLLFDRGLVG